MAVAVAVCVCVCKLSHSSLSLTTHPQLPIRLYEDSFPKVLPFLVADFTLTEYSNLSTTTSLLRSQCHGEDGVLLGSWLQDTDQKMIEDQLEPLTGSGLATIENNPW